MNRWTGSHRRIGRMCAEDDEFLAAEQHHAQERERLGEEEWERLYYIRCFHLWAEAPGGRRAREEIEMRVRDLSTLPSSVSRNGAVAGGDISYSGLHTWGSAVALAQYVLAKPYLFTGKDVVELGAGTGLLSLVASRLAASVVATDRNQDLLNNVVHSAELNNENLLLGGAARIQTQILLWEDVSSHAGVSADVILGAEIFHEQRTMQHLACLVAHTLRSSGGLFLGVSPGGARREAIDTFKRHCEDFRGEGQEILTVAEEAFPVEMMLDESRDEWDTGSCEEDRLVLITVRKH